MKRMSCLVIGLIVFSSAIVPGAAVSEETMDVTFRTAYDSARRPQNAQFYFNGRAIGDGRESFRMIVDQIAKLPAGTSIVWGPKYARCCSCSGEQPSSVSQFLYPDLWDEMIMYVEKNQLSLSSAYPGPIERTTEFTDAGRMPAAVLSTSIAARKPHDAILNWEVDEHGEPKYAFSTTDRSLESGNITTNYEVEFFLAQLPENARILIVVTLREGIDPQKEQDLVASVTDKMRSTWKDLIYPALHRGRLKATLVAPGVLTNAINPKVKSKNSLMIGWSNFRGMETPHQEVLYTVNGEYVGRGDEGFEQILTRLAQLEIGAQVIVPRYKYVGRWVYYRFRTREDREAANAGLLDLLPFASRRQEFDAIIGDRELEIVDEEAPLANENPLKALQWGPGDIFAQTVMRSGRVVRHDQRPRRPAVRLGWAGYDAADVKAAQIESNAICTLDDIELGQGITGFSTAMERLEKLPAGSVVHVKVCLRTQGPFVCALIYEGHRHLERTGIEPYSGMFPWLVDVAEKHQLEIEWIPDQKAGLRDCELCGGGRSSLGEP